MVNWTGKRVEDWAKDHFANCPISGVWAPDGTGLIFLKAEQKKWKLIRAIDHETTIQALSGICTLMFDLGYSLEENDVMWDEAPQTMEEAAEIEASQKRDIANLWTDEDGMKLREMNPYDAFPVIIGKKEVQLDEGKIDSLDLWAFPLTNPLTGRVTKLDPGDYRLLTDDRHYMRFRNSEGTVYQALTRKEIMNLADATARDGEVKTMEIIDFTGSEIVGSIDRQTLEKVPSWMWGTICGVLTY